MPSGLKNQKYYSKGKRSIVFKAELNGKEVIIKKSNKNSVNHVIKNEAKWLRLVNKHNLGPKIIKEGKDYVIMEFIKGKPVMEFFESVKKDRILKVISRIINKCRKLDSLNIVKQEMHRPIKHILVYENNPRFLDFERCRFSENPKNLTQFCQFLTKKKTSEILKKKGINIDEEILRKFLRKYKKN